MQTPGNTTRNARVQWIDTAKGVAILLVVLGHSVAVLASEGVGVGPWQEVNALLSTARMPLFFLVSGLLASSSLYRPLPRFVDSKILLLVYLYALWVVLHAIIAGIREGGDGFVAAVLAALSDGLMLHSSLWYLPALAVFYAAARVMRAVPVAAQLSVAVSSYVLFASFVLETGSTGVNGIGHYFVFFLAGCCGRRLIAGFMARLTVMRAVLICAALILVAGATAVADATWDAASNIGAVALGPLGAATGLAVAGIVARARWSRAIMWVGTRTIPVYVLHLQIVLAIAALTAPVFMLSQGLALAAPVLIAGVAVLASYAIWRATRRVPGLYTAPSWLRVERVPQRVAA
ncbi:hypothetical protein GY21_01430 [Cryobacterium roopkundense]|uniref:Fucose 4-O-acetylase-like acetyltransferase n=1 Tax=Cryobacterium roopkundense TaxID=1001240 RepID=A0A099JUA8_9MICO|nr:acyltransferase [Cryobacterium roopkundense]KGJ81766.1 hypothetical protein GY21_01430 [Cryobacterium roopkundense]MBB5642426.1 fucose 4-O-acetylase-like acetyltransferase [Cryobacterium roopkundense]